MVAPLAVDMQVAQSKALIAKTQLLDDPQARGVLGPDVDLDPMQPQPKKRLVAGGRQRKWHDPLSCNGFGNPVARRGRSQGAPSDTEQMHLADQSPLGLNDKGLKAALSGLAIELANQLAEGEPGRYRLGRGGLPRPEPLGVLGPQRLPLTSILAAQGPQDHRGTADPTSRDRHGPQSTGQWSPPRICDKACATTGSSTVSPLVTPPIDPGRLTTRVRPATPLMPRDNMADGMPAPTPAARMASAIPGTSRSTTRCVASGMPSVGVSPVPPVVTTNTAPVEMAARRATSTWGPSATTTASPTARPQPRSASTMIGPARSG